MNDLMTYKTVGDKLQLHPGTVARLVRAGKLSAIRIGKNTPRISTEALEAFLKAVTL